MYSIRLLKNICVPCVPSIYIYVYPIKLSNYHVEKTQVLSMVLSQLLLLPYAIL